MDRVTGGPQPVHRQMPLAFPTPHHMPCPDCGASVPVATDAAHVCEPERALDFRLVELRPEIARFEADYAAWLETPSGRFARFVAERDR
jgi:hypothetical protein